MIGTAETIWEIPDHLWKQIRPVILEMDHPKATGRKRVYPRWMVDGIVLRIRSGCQWNRLPRELGDDSTIHRTFQRWMVERTLAWLSKCRASLVRCDKKVSNHIGLIQMACGLHWYRHQHRLLS